MEKQDRSTTELTPEERAAQDLAIHNWKQSGGPWRDNEARALRLQQKYQPLDNN